MSDRRQTSRLVVSDMTEGCLRLMHDSYIEAASNGRIVAWSDAALPVGESVALELARELDARCLVRVRVVSSTTLQRRPHPHRLELALPQVDDPASAADPVLAAATRALARAPVPAIGVLIRRVPVRVRDVSASGCQLETASPLAEGAIGLLEISTGGRRQAEALRVCRSHRLPASPWPWRSGAHFLGLRAPAASSLRNLAARFEIVDELGGATKVPGISPGETGDEGFPQDGRL